MLAPKHITALFVALFVAVDASNIIPRNEDGSLDLSDRYIVSMKPNVDFEQHLNYVQNIHNEALARRDGRVFQGLSSNFSIADFNAYAGHFHPSVVEQLKAHSDIAAVETDQELSPQTDDYKECCTDCGGDGKSDDGKDGDGKSDKRALDEDIIEDAPGPGLGHGRPIGAPGRGPIGEPPAGSGVVKPGPRPGANPRRPPPRGRRPDPDDGPRKVHPGPSLQRPGRGAMPPIPIKENLVKQSNAVWNLRDISHRVLGRYSSYYYVRQAGRGSFVYFIDSGIDSENNEFRDRLGNTGIRAEANEPNILPGFNALKPHGPPGKAPSSPHHPGKPSRKARVKDTSAIDQYDETPDENGHGTYIAAIIGGKTYGVAKRTALVPIKVMDKRMSTSVSLFLTGFEWAVKDIIRTGRVKESVINCSPSGNFNAAMNQAVDAAYSRGIITVVPAGNQNSDAKLMSPASSLRAITVGGTDRQRHRTRSSNFGARVNIFAPASNVCSAWIGSRRATRSASGTAAAAAHVSGLIAYFKSYNHLRTAETTWNFVQITGIPGAVYNTKGANDLLAYNLSGK